MSSYESVDNLSHLLEKIMCRKVDNSVCECNDCGIKWYVSGKKC